VRTTRIDEIAAIPIVDGRIRWRPVRRTLGIEAFGVNAYTADAGQEVVEDHDEMGSGAGRHEELYVVVSGRATFTVGGRELDAPAGTLVFLDDPAERRAARAVEDGTTVLVVGGARGEAFRISPWEYAFYGLGMLERGDAGEARRVLEEGVERYPDNPSMTYNLACVLARTGDAEGAFDQLRRAIAAEPRLAEHAKTDPDLDAIRSDPRFPA
jgi:hypothetical protein